MQNFTFNIKHFDNYFIAQLEGRIMNDDTITELLEAITKALEKNDNIILDLQKLTYLNSSGLNCFITILTKSRVKGGETIITNIPEVINKLLIISKLNTVFEIRTSLEEAQKEFSLIKS
ncbi:MAG: STAS domain-containing protein [Flavobacteriales bacterium]|nr:STAS domain-containing protein [Flavobacteriales bacterium]